MMCWMTLEWSAEKTEVWFREAVSWFKFRNLDCKYDVVVGPVADDTVGLLIRQFSRGTIDAEYLKKEFDFGTLTNQYTFHTEKALKYLKKVDVMYDKSATGND